MFFNREFKHVKDLFTDGQYKLNRIDAMILGMWPEQSLPIRILLPAFYTCIELSILIPETRRLVKAKGDLDILMAGAPSILVQLAGGLKLYTVSLNNDVFLEAMRQIREDWAKFNNPFTGHVMYKYATVGYKGTLVYQVALYMTTVMFISFPILPSLLDVINPLNESRSKPPIFETDYGINMDDYFAFRVFHGFICTLIVIHIFVSVDSLVFIMVEHCGSLCEIIGVVLDQLNDETKNHTEHEEYKIISSAIDIHKRAINFASFVQSTFSKMYGIILIINMLVISMTGVMIVVEMGRKDLGSAIRYAIYCVGTIVHLFANSIPGQELYDHSESAFNTVYNCNWTMLSIKAKKFINFMLMRSIRPSTIAAGGFYVMNMENFGSIVKTSMSYLTVLTSMR